MTLTNWLWLSAVGVMPNVLALALLVLGLRAKTAQPLARLQKRAVACVVTVGFGSGVGVALGAYTASRAMHSGSVDVAQKARMLAEGIANAMNGVALGLVASPLPIAAVVIIAVRAKRLASPAAQLRETKVGD